MTQTYNKNFFGENHDGKYVDETIRDYFPDYRYKGVFFDVGAFEPIRISNSHHFHVNGWDVYSFEANPSKIPLLEKHRNFVFNYAVSDSDSAEPILFENVVKKDDPSWTASYSAIKVSDKYKKIFGFREDVFKIEQLPVEQKTLNTIIKDEIPDLSHIDVMSLDIEGYELQCLKGLDLEKFPPKLIVVENADHDATLKMYLAQYGYKLDKAIRYNEYYTHKTYIPVPKPPVVALPPKKHVKTQPNLPKRLEKYLNK